MYKMDRFGAKIQISHTLGPENSPNVSLLFLLWKISVVFLRIDDNFTEMILLNKLLKATVNISVTHATWVDLMLNLLFILKFK